METNKHQVIGVVDDDVFISNTTSSMYVIRPVTKSALESLRSIEGLKDYGYKELWQNAVMGDATELGFDDYLQELLDDSDILNDEESFPNKDYSFTQYLDDESRKIVEDYLYEKTGKEIGTWECSGIFTPTRKFDLVINQQLANEFYKKMGWE